MRLHLCAFLLLTAVVSCSHLPVKKENSYLCREHGTHHLNDKKEFCACFSIDAARTEDYLIFSKESRITGNESALAQSLKNEVADEITTMIVRKLEEAFGADLLSNWQLERIDLPVIFRTFMADGSEGKMMKSVAVARKEDFTPRALIRFLPLEYKMKLMKPEEKDKDPLRK